MADQVPIMGADDLNMHADSSSSSSRPNFTEMANENSWRGYAAWMLVYAAKNPWDFIYYVVLCLSPFLIMSLIASLKLYKELDSKNNKDKKRRARHSANASKVRRGKNE